MTTAHKPALRTVTTLSALLFTPLFLAATASAQQSPPCPNGSTHGGFPDGTGTVYLDFSGFPNPDAVYQGGDFWNSAQLAYGQGSWPTFQTTNGSVPNHVQIIYRDGLAVNPDGSPLRAPNGDRPPASFDPNTGTVTVWGQYTMDNVLEETPIYDTHGTSNLISHELGHSLGLENDGCVEGIMEVGFDPFDDPNLQVTGAEAYQTDEENYTHYEEEGTAGKNSQCLPDDVVCQGSPIVLNLTHGPYVLTDAADGVRFKLEPTGQAQSIAWTAAEAEQAFLWLDRNGNGTVDDGSELFGNFTRLQDGTRARNGFEALREFDANHDGIVDEQDPIWNSLQLWTDRNHNGVAEPDEVMPISASRVKKITLDYHWTGQRDQFGNVLRYQAGMIIENSRGVQQYRPIYDIYFVRATQ